MAMLGDIGNFLNPNQTLQSAIDLLQKKFEKITKVEIFITKRKKPKRRKVTMTLERQIFFGSDVKILDVLNKATKPLTKEEISKIIGISPKTIRDSIARMSDKKNIRSKL